MKICCAISTLSTSGGLQRDCLNITARLCRSGHDVTIFTTRRIGDIESSANIEVVPVRIFSNIDRDRKLGEWLLDRREDYDCVVGFNKMAGLDIYYAGDLPYHFAKPGWWRKYSPRFRAQQKLESLVFGSEYPVKIIMLSERQSALYKAFWETQDSRIRVIGPTLDPARIRPDLRTAGYCAAMRSELGLINKAVVALTVGANVKVKGLDRAAASLSQIRNVHWIVVGSRAKSREENKLRALADRFGLSGRLTLLGVQENVPAIMAASDFLLHPARVENTGTVILEALANGLPVVVSEDCGYAAHVRKSGAGLVLANRDDPGIWRNAIVEALDEEMRERWSKLALAYSTSQTLSGGLDEACSLIEEWC